MSGFGHSTAIGKRDVTRGATEPTNVRAGHIWIDTSGNNNEFNQYTGSTWELVIARGPDNPQYPVEGSLWRDTSTSVLNQYDGATWTQVGAGLTVAQEELDGTTGDTGTQLTINSADTVAFVALWATVDNDGSFILAEYTRVRVTYADASTDTYSLTTGDGNTNSKETSGLLAFGGQVSKTIDTIELLYDSDGSGSAVPKTHRWHVAYV